MTPSSPPSRRRRLRPLLAILGAALLGAGLTAGILFATGTVGGTTQTISPAQELALNDRGLADVVRSAFGSVAELQVLTSSDEQAGTGIVVDSAGLVLTNNHVVSGASVIRVTLPVPSAAVPEDAEVVAATPRSTRSGVVIVRVTGVVVATAPRLDLAVVRVPLDGLRAMPFASPADPRLGQRVIAIGYALSLTGGPSVTSGIVSATHRDVTADDGETYRSLIQTDASINHGNSGGPLLDTSGRLIGINTIVASARSAENVGFAVPAAGARTLIERARD